MIDSSSNNILLFYHSCIFCLWRTFPCSPFSTIFDLFDSLVALVYKGNQQKTKMKTISVNKIISVMTCYWEGKFIKLPPFILYIIQLYVIQSIKKIVYYQIIMNVVLCHQAKGTGRHTIVQGGKQMTQDSAQRVQNGIEGSRMLSIYS